MPLAALPELAARDGVDCRATDPTHNRVASASETPESPMADFSNLVTGFAAAIGLVVMAVGRVVIPGRRTVRGVLVRLAGAVLLLPWPASQGIALLAQAAREVDGSPPDKPETVQLITAFVQLVLLFWAGVISLGMTLVASTLGRPSRRGQSDRTASPRPYGR